MKKLNLVIALASFWSVAIGGAVGAHAQSYPSKPIRLIVSTGPGVFTDIAARMIAAKVSPALGQSIIVDNVTGADGIIAARTAAKAPPDGYTIFISSGSTQSAAPFLFNSLQYDPIKDFSSITLLGVINSFLIVPAASPLKSIDDMIARAKQSPPLLQGIGNAAARFSGGLFMMMTGVKFTEVPYTSPAQATSDLAAGRVDFMFNGVGTSMPFVQQGQVRALAITSKERMKAMPDIPTVAEKLPGYFSFGWVGVFAPAGTPPEIVQRLNKEFISAVTDPDIVSKLAALGFAVQTTTPGELDAFIAEDSEMWKRVTSEGNWEKR